ncbi:hypothetical protein [Pseudomonas sp. 58 R 12]|uniref:hypothetical protein n=1 Tax=Pseudomonas sp. 58 R 12 TaxID=1844107 RepID=UPI000812AA94|nr:hypothetical protein [Pseudomonas sp. 58 R 12]CRM50585.1 hypothetical protein [Pseudomonas sp. 58 R 12]
MKKLGSIVGDLYHKHYIEDAFATYKATPGLKDVLIVTYCNYLDVVSALKFLNDHVFPNGERHRVIIGLGGIGDGRGLKVDRFKSELTTLIERIPVNVELNIHAACHVKMLSYGSLTTIGSQNLSSASLSLSTRTHAKYKYHEAQIEFKDPDQLHAKKLFQEILCDSSMYAKISSESNAGAVADFIIKGAKAEGVSQKIQLATDLSELLNESIAIPSSLKVEPSVENNLYFIQALIKFYHAKDVGSHHVDNLYRTIYTDGGDYPAGEEFTDYVFEISQLVELVDQVALPQKQAVLNIFRAVYSSRLGFAEEEDFESFVEELRTVVENHYATDMNELIDKHQHDLVQHIIENPDCTQVIEFCRTDEGVLAEQCIHQALLDGDIDVDGYLGDLDFSEYIRDVHKLFEVYYIAGLHRAFDEVHGAYDDFSQAYEREILAAQ